MRNNNHVNGVLIIRKNKPHSRCVAIRLFYCRVKTFIKLFTTYLTFDILDLTSKIALKASYSIKQLDNK